MIIFLLGLIVFFSVHALSALPTHKQMVMERVGNVRNYRILHGAVALLGMALIIYGWQLSGFMRIYTPLKSMKHLVLLLMAPVFILGVAQFLPGRIKMTLKFPLLFAVKLWALSHLLANGDVNGVLFFGAFLAWAGWVRVVKKRQSIGAPAASFGLPPEPKLSYDVIAVLGGLALYGLGLVLHPIIIGVAVLPH